MDNCCQVPAGVHRDRTICPVSRTTGQAVGLLTVKALLTETALQRVRRASYSFCPDTTCDVVYFDDHSDVFTRSDLRVAVWQKEPAGARTICYCFGENEADIRSEIVKTGTSRAVERVREHIAAGRCACDIRNPRGRCCLGDVMQAVKGMQAVDGLCQAATGARSDAPEPGPAR